MNILLPELLGEICQHLENIGPFALTSKLCSDISKPYLKTAYVKHFSKNVPPEMIEAFGGIQKIESYDVFKIITCSDYIDYISPKMMPSTIVYGIDPYKRRFFCIRYTDGYKISVVTLFQRYTDEQFSWRACGHFNFCYIFDTSYGSEFNMNLLANLVKGKETTFTTMDTVKKIKLF